WLGGRAEPPDAARMTGADYDGVQCDLCHRRADPHFEATNRGLGESADWVGYWDESGRSGTPSAAAAAFTLGEDRTAAVTLRLFNGSAQYQVNGWPTQQTWIEATNGQMFVTGNDRKRGPFADANARHEMRYSRFHKSRAMCATCHDVSNPLLANLERFAARPGDGSEPLPTEVAPAAAWFHLERTHSEFMLSAFGAPGGAFGEGPYAPDRFPTSRPENRIATCQDCHMADADGPGAGQNNAVDRPSGSAEHPKSGQPMHDLTGGNLWIPAVLASTQPGSPNHDPEVAGLLSQGAAVLTLALDQGTGLNPTALLAGVERARAQLLQAARIDELIYDAATGRLSFRVVNQTGHKLPTGFSEGRRMFVTVQGWQGDHLAVVINPYDPVVGTLKGLHHPDSPPLGVGERYQPYLVYEVASGSLLTGEDETFHLALATHRTKDNRIPPRGFRIAEAAVRQSEPVFAGQARPDLFTAAEYAGGYDQVVQHLPPGLTRVRVTVSYQTTSREYVAFLRDELNGQGTTLPSPGPTGLAVAYRAPLDAAFDAQRAWGDVIWRVWARTKDWPGAAPVPLTEASWP
ncbi:MAG: hypothetical protein KC613_19440, partial [Myxococcales bacterium]|nr:hypothetical protein [Myxococcales bacterium]